MQNIMLPSLRAFHKYLEPFLCIIGISRNYTLDEDTYPQFPRDNDEEMDFLSFIRTADPTKVRVGERQRAEGEPKLMDTTVGRVVPLLPIVAEDAAPVQPRRQRKRKTVVSDAGEPPHPPKKLREDHETSTGPSVAGANIAEAEVDSFARPSVPLMTMTTFVTSTVDPTTTAKEKFIESFVFGGGSSSGAEHTVCSFSGLTGSDFNVGGIRTVVSPDTDLQKV
ncbi:hypothetical protein Tco_0174271, partial [Tanacetum coccineum]